MDIIADMMNARSRYMGHEQLTWDETLRSVWQRTDGADRLFAVFSQDPGAALKLIEELPDESKLMLFSMILSNPHVSTTTARFAAGVQDIDFGEKQ